MLLTADPSFQSLGIFSSFKITFYLWFGVCICHSTSIRSEGHLQQSVLSYCMCLGNQIQVVRVGGKYLYTLRHPDCLGILKF